MKKISLVLVFTVFLGILDACIDCGCGKTLPYFDFSSLALTATAPAIDGKPLQINVRPDDLTYLACLHPRLLSAAYACSCNENGDQGPKYPLAEISVTADRDFNAALPAGAELNSLFRLTNALQTTPEHPLDTISRLQYWAYGFSPYESGFTLHCQATPDSSGLAFRFTITLKKSDGSAVSGETEAISW